MISFGAMNVKSERQKIVKHACDNLEVVVCTRAKFKCLYLCPTLNCFGFNETTWQNLTLPWRRKVPNRGQVMYLKM